MFKIFNKEKVAIQETPKSINETIEEIHNAFYSEVDKLLEGAKISKSLDTDKQDLLDKCTRLKAVGFSNTAEVKEAEEEIHRLGWVEAENAIKKDLTDAITHFSFKYPNYKFITEDSVKRICEKYGLFYAEVEHYTGTVPDKNLKHIEDFNISDKDECFVEEIFYHDILKPNTRTRPSYTSAYQGKLEDDERKRLNNSREGYRRHYRSEIRKICPLEIAAPVKDFDTKNMSVDGFKLSKIEIPDPIVLKPVVFNNKKHYLVVTAWGLEASDELVVNQKLN
jgi:hypothetical protein